MIPSTYLSSQGGFEDLAKIRAAFGVDLIGLVGVDQVQFEDTGTSSWSYWTVVGAYVVKGQKHETHTVLETAVYDITSRSLLFRASGESANTEFAGLRRD